MPSSLCTHQRKQGGQGHQGQSYAFQKADPVERFLLLLAFPKSLLAIATLMPGEGRVGNVSSETVQVLVIAADS